MKHSQDYIVPAINCLMENGVRRHRANCVDASFLGCGITAFGNACAGTGCGITQSSGFGATEGGSVSGGVFFSFSGTAACSWRECSGAGARREGSGRRARDAVGVEVEARCPQPLAELWQDFLHVVI